MVTVTVTDTGTLRVTRVVPEDQLWVTGLRSIGAGIPLGLLVLAVALAAAARSAVAVGILLGLGIPLFFWWAEGRSRLDAWVEIDPVQRTVRSCRPTIDPMVSEEPLADFTAVELAPESFEGDTSWILILQRRDSMWPLEVVASGDSTEIVPVALRLAEVTGLPLGEQARCLVSPLKR